MFSVVVEFSDEELFASVELSDEELFSSVEFPYESVSLYSLTDVSFSFVLSLLSLVEF